MANPYLSMDGSGFITIPSLKADAILASYASTQHSQTVLYRNIISSLSKDIQLCSQKWDKLPDFVKTSLSRLFNAYFDQADVEVTIDEDTMNADTGTFNMYIMATLTQDSKTYDLSKLLTITNNKFASVSDFSLGNSHYAQ